MNIRPSVMCAVIGNLCTSCNLVFRVLMTI